MRKFNLLILFSFLLLFNVSYAQRYLKQTFTGVDVTRNVVYGTNATVLTYSAYGEAVPERLFMDVYRPTGDTKSDRPLVIYLHTGNFLPVPVNGSITGTRNDSVTVEIATRLTKMGYVVAVADYRLGWNPLATTQPERAYGLINAAYRGVQDGRTCVRFFKNQIKTQGNAWGVDSTKITVWGQGTGGYISLAMATLNKYSEIATTTTPTGKFLYDHDKNSATAIIPMVIEGINGDIEGKKLGISPVPVTVNGASKIDTLCYPNFPKETSNFQLAVNMGGALGDISWLEAGDAPMISFQCPTDPFAPYESRVLVVPTTNDPIVEVQGAYTIINKANELGNNKKFVDANLSDATTVAAKAASAKTGKAYKEGLYPFIRPIPPAPAFPEGSPWDWWNASVWSTVAHPSCGTATPPTCSFHTIGLLGNPGMSATQGRAYVDTIIAYFAPRAVVALGLSTSTKEVIDGNEVGFQAFPNPVTASVFFQTDEENPMQEISLYDMSGRMVQNHKSVNNSYYTVNRQGLPTGMYIARIRIDKGVISKKLFLE